MTRAPRARRDSRLLSPDRGLHCSLASGLFLALLVIPVTGAPQSATATKSDVPQLPAPTGPFAVGRKAYHWTDSSRLEPRSAQVGARRELMVYAWYPAQARLHAERAPYLPDVGAIGSADVRSEFGAAGAMIETGKLRSHTAADAILASSKTPFPVLVFSHGFSETGFIYTAQLEDLASHGYVVFAIEHPYDAFAVVFPGARVVRFAQAEWDSAKAQPNGAVGYQLAQIVPRTADIHFVIDRLFLSSGRAAALFAGRLDLARLGVFGHSLGGMAAAQACLADSRIHACMNQDADFQGRPYADTSVQISLRQPFLFFVTPHSLYLGRRTVPPTDESLASQKLTRVQYDSIVHQYQKNQDNALTRVAGSSYRVNAEAPDFTHRSFMDFRLLNAAGDGAALARHERYLTIVRAYTKAFFDKYLKGRSDSLLDGSAVIDSAVTVDRFRPRPR